MAPTSPLNPLHQQAEASFLPYTGQGGEGRAPGIVAQVVETFGELEGEYAALRKGCVLLDLPQRGTLRLTGAGRIEFLNRMVTQELKGLRHFNAREAFWLNRKGRIEADLRLIELPDEMFVDLDVLAAAGTTASLGGYVFSEAVEIADRSEGMHRLALHGPTSVRLLAAVSKHVDGPTVSDLSVGHASVVMIASHRVIVDRHDPANEIGLELLMETSHVQEVYEQFLEIGLDHNGQRSGAEAVRMRPAGWHAFNIARIEAGTALFNIDFGTSSLPAETGIIEKRVSFTKGCYLGQEVVARMHSLGHPKQVLVGVRAQPTPAQSDSGLECQPVTGASCYTEGDASRAGVGVVTSSTRSPMLGDAIICFAQLKYDYSKPGTRLLIETDAGPTPGVVQDSLAFWKRPPE